MTRSATAPSEQDGRSGSGSSKARTAGTGSKSFGAGMGGSNAVEEDGVRNVPLVLEKYTLYETKTVRRATCFPRLFSQLMLLLSSCRSST